MLRGITHSLAYRIRHCPLSRAIDTLRATLLATSVMLGVFAGISCNGAGQASATSRSYQSTQQQARQRAEQSARPSRVAAAPAPVSGIRVGIGFGSRSQFDDHFVKHGAEFGQITKQEYLRQAQTLRDEPAGGNVLEIRRQDGTVSRYNRMSGAFIAFNTDGTIRTFFKPNNGEGYFRRQAMRSH